MRSRLAAGIVLALAPLGGAAALESVFDGGGTRDGAAVAILGLRGAMEIPGQRLDDALVRNDADGTTLLLALGLADSHDFAELTAAHVGLRLRMSVCGFVLAEPLVREAIVGGVIALSVDTPERAAALAEALAGEAPCPGGAE